MKELSIEEKAKRYDKAIEIAKEINNEQRAQPFNIMTRVFPELKESEDEKVRKEIYQFVYEQRPEDNWLAWLEKQGEQKSFDDIAKEVTRNKETAMSFLKSCGIMNANGELADEYKIEQDEQKPAWSEDDEDKLVLIGKAIFSLVNDGITKNDANNLYNWLKSLKDRYTWKPSDEQMKLLREVQQALLGKDCHNRFVNFMYELKKLKEE